ncbi:hypothetical protein F2Q69_00036542 [Brassica cretica]|uniref:Uncharacterized protein n=1 Tax=Brassica cretica TaxID=69181 RepID=A0A8S9SNV1_BRACR|nr:hypothetical protein F2Q69_00036542 [Brassica cretica]
MGEATSQVLGLVSSDSEPACVAGFLSFREKLARRKAEKEPVRADTEPPSSSVLVVTLTHEPEVQVPQDAGAQDETGFSCVPDALAKPSGSSTTPALVEGKEKAAESMPPPPARKEIVLALHAPSATPVVQPKGRKRRCTRGNALHVEFQTRLAKISDFLGSLECIRGRDLALATVDGGMAVVQAVQSETPSSLQAKEARLSACKGDLVAVDGSFDLILADLRSECFLPTCTQRGKILRSGKTKATRPRSWTKRWVKGRFR